MSQCIDCANRPSDNDSLGGAEHEGTVTPTVIGIIVGTVAIFILVVSALFYCVKLERDKYMAKMGDMAATAVPRSLTSSASSVHETFRPVVESRLSSATVVSRAPPQHEDYNGESPRAVMGASVADGSSGKKRRLFGWGKRRSGVSTADSSPVTAVEMV
ncbi:hypothetical protein M406DRAFT_71553 [Cryphonectria parasitica EP155]|uniref:Uncharacterized protein n=1 Tax=Cryphonectria parasitica (strain ATCC 38755 / EP155) TaxID=660469 RepID=A0A9P4Y7W7_CRYP1|nr:uncharacterized protein M406DRAFT_71553 [Cryphonectria parasitica EP155]KAF3768562.1 hypothetical protein M406DRAFT_71553 [Cryphonectria parasitica EP155]